MKYRTDGRNANYDYCNRQYRQLIRDLEDYKLERDWRAASLVSPTADPQIIKYNEIIDFYESKKHGMSLGLTCRRELENATDEGRTHSLLRLIDEEPAKLWDLRYGV